MYANTEKQFQQQFQQNLFLTYVIRIKRRGFNFCRRITTLHCMFNVQKNKKEIGQLAKGAWSKGGMVVKRGHFEMGENFLEKKTKSVPNALIRRENQ